MLCVLRAAAWGWHYRVWRDDEALRKSFQIILFRIDVLLIFDQVFEDSLKYVVEIGGVRPLNALRPALFVVKQANHIHKLAVWAPALLVDKGLGWAEAAHQIIDSLRADKFFVHAKETRGVGILEAEIHIDDVFWLNLALVRDQLQQTAVVVLILKPGLLRNIRIVGLIKLVIDRVRDNGPEMLLIIRLEFDSFLTLWKFQFCSGKL